MVAPRLQWRVMDLCPTASIDPRFAGIDRLYGVGASARLGASSVCVVGLGGVGSWAVEALARSGIGRLVLVDADEVCVSNTNRQLHALDGQYGRAKAEVLAERVRAIHPGCRVEVLQRFLSVDTLEAVLGDGHDLVLEAADSIPVKVASVAWCRRRKLRQVVVGSAGGRSDPTLVRVRDLSRTEQDAMLALVRKQLRAGHGFPRNPDRFFSVPAVYSLENVRYPQRDGSVSGRRPQLAPGEALKLDCGDGLGAATHVTGTFAFAAVGKAIELLLKPAPGQGADAG